MATRCLATWSHDLQYSDLPGDVIHAAVQSFYNWVGCAIAGSQHEATQIAVCLDFLTSNKANTQAASVTVALRRSSYCIPPWTSRSCSSRCPACSAHQWHSLTRT